MWAAEGTWHDVLGIEPHKIVEASGKVMMGLERSRSSSLLLNPFLGLCRPTCREVKRKALGVNSNDIVRVAGGVVTDLMND